MLDYPWHDVRTDSKGRVHARCWAWNRGYAPSILILAIFQPQCASCRRVTSTYSQMGAAVYPTGSLEEALSLAPRLIGDLKPSPAGMKKLLDHLRRA